MKFTPLALVACLLAQGHGAFGASSKNDERKLQYGHGYHNSGYHPVFVAPTFPPTESPTPRPTPLPTDNPTSEPTPVPSARPTPRPTPLPTPMPSYRPTPRPPTKRPTEFPTELERTPFPTPVPTHHPTRFPTPVPSQKPTTATPTRSPTAKPSATPTTAEPSDEPTEYPTVSAEPSEEPTGSEEPSESPTETAYPSDSPSVSLEPTVTPLKTIAEFLCDESNIDLYGNMCTMIRRTGLDFILNNFQVLEGTFDDFYDFVNFGPFAPLFQSRRALADSDRSLTLMTPLMTPIFMDSVLMSSGEELPGVPNLSAQEFVDFFEANYKEFLDENPFKVDEFDEFVKAFLKSKDPVFTVFAPLNSAWMDISDGVIAEIDEEIADGNNVALGVVETAIITERELMLKDLKCGVQYLMSNGEKTLLDCEDESKFLIGGGNIEADGQPKIQKFYKNEVCSNGIVQTVDFVVLPEVLKPVTPSPSVTPSAPPTMAPSSTPSTTPSSTPSMAPAP